MSYPTHLIKINNRFYYKVKVPVDLQQYFPCTFIKKSFRTSNLSAAKSMLAVMEYATHRGFTLLRTGMLPDDIAVKVVQGLVPAVKQKPVDPPKVNILSTIIEKYIAAKQGEWTEKTKMEVNCVVKLLQDALGDVDVTAITRPMVLDLRATLQKLPTNMYKKYPGQSISQVIAKGDKSTLSTKSVNKHITRLGAILRYCVDEGILLSNPAHGLKVSEKKRVDQERGVYSNADISTIFRLLPKNDACPER